MPLWLRRWLTDGQDSEAKSTGYRYTTERHYDEAKAVAAAQRARRHTATGRPIGSTQERGKVEPFRSKVAK